MKGGNRYIGLLGVSFDQSGIRELTFMRFLMRFELLFHCETPITSFMGTRKWFCPRRHMCQSMYTEQIAFCKRFITVITLFLSASVLKLPIAQLT